LSGVAATVPQSAIEPLLVQIRPDPWQRRQVARWVLALFEISILTGIASLIGSVAAGLAGSAIAAAIGNDAIGIAIPGFIWRMIGGLLAGYLTLRYLASE
jgi:hypothetical protein